MVRSWSVDRHPFQLKCQETELAGSPYATCNRDQSPLPAAQRMTLGLKMNLNSVSAQELELLPGIGPALAKDLIESRLMLRGFRTWTEVDAVPGVGPAKLKIIQQFTEIPTP